MFKLNKKIIKIGIVLIGTVTAIVTGNFDIVNINFDETGINISNAIDVIAESLINTFCNIFNN